MLTCCSEKTAVLGHVRTEINCLPVENDEYKRVMDERANQALKPKKETQFLTGLVSSHAGNLLAPGTLGSPGNFNKFIVCAISSFTRALLIRLENYGSNAWKAPRVQSRENASERALGLDY